MSNYPLDYDDDTTLPVVNDNLTEQGGVAIDALRDAVMAMQGALGLNIAGTQPNLAARLGVFINPDGSPNASVITALGLVTLPIRNDQIADNAGIPESKLHLDYRTGDLFNYIRDLSKDVNLAIGWISVSGVKLEPHLIGALYRHDLAQIDVAETATQFLNNVFRALRDNTDAYTLINDMNNELLEHQWKDGSPYTNQAITTHNGSLLAAFYAHPASGIFLNTTRFNNLPQTADNVQLFAEFLDNESIFVLGTRIQNLYSNGISRVSRSSSLVTDGYGQSIVPPTAAIAYLKDIGNNSAPFDDINAGDDVIQFTPPFNDGYAFDEKFALVKVGDIVRVNYGTIETSFVIKEKKYAFNGTSKTFIVRIAGKNIQYAPNAIARIDKPLFNRNKYGELSISPVNNQFGSIPSLVINNPRGAQALGLGFDPDQFDETHFYLYLAFYPTGNPSDGYILMPGIDVTGNRGTTPGLYTLESIVQATNNAFRAAGYNYRFTAFDYQGEFGICLSDSYNNPAFSVLNVCLDPNGFIDVLQTSLNFPNNVIDVQPTIGNVAPDPLGFGPMGAGIASPPFYAVYGSSPASQIPTKLFPCLRRNTYYVNGAESERLAIEPTQSLDSYGDGYWVATIQNFQDLTGRVETTYRIPFDLSASNLKIGKTLVVQAHDISQGTITDFGRFIIKDVSLSCSFDGYTDVTVFDSVHAAGFSPTVTLGLGGQVLIYFSADSVSFNAESATDFSNVTPFKRHFEVYVDDAGNTFTHERGRLNASGNTLTINGVPVYGYAQLNKWDIVKISPKLRGYQFGSVNKITLSIFNYSDVTGVYDGYLASYDGTNFTHFGPLTTGKKGKVTRFYDETNTDYIDIQLDINTSVSAFSNQVMDFQLFPTLSLDEEIFLLGTCQVDDTIQKVSKILDQRQFGNISEKDLSTSVFDYMAAPERNLHVNGVIRGFDVDPSTMFQGAKALISVSGGVVLVDGRIIDVNNETVFIPIVREYNGGTYFSIDWAICINNEGEYELIPLLDYDPTIGNPVSPNRLMFVTDPVSGQSYYLDAITFSDLVSIRTDLVPLYILGAQVSLSPSLTISYDGVRDVRRFIRKKDWGEAPVFVGGDHTLGDFRTWDALNNWFTFNYQYNNTVVVKGIFTDVPGDFGLPNPGKIIGDGNAVFSTDVGNAIQSSNTEFHNITFNGFSFNLPAGSLLSNCICNMNIGGGTSTFNAGTTVSDTIFNASNGSSGFQFFSETLIDRCTFNITGISSYLNVDTTRITNTTFNISAGDFTFYTAGSAVFENCVFILSQGSTFFNLGGGTTLNNCTFYYTGAGTQLPIICQSAFNMYGNTFFGNFGSPVPTSFVLINDGVSGSIVNNRFYRGSSALTQGYIAGPSSYTSGVVVISNNFFDQTTIDGTSSLFVTNKPLPWIFSNNLNAPPTQTIKRLSGSFVYTVQPYDDIISVGNLTTPSEIVLPQISLTMPGRRITIVDGTGTLSPTGLFLGIFPALGTETIEGLTGGFIYNVTWGSITLISDNGGWTVI